MLPHFMGKLETGALPVGRGYVIPILSQGVQKNGQPTKVCSPSVHLFPPMVWPVE